MQKTIIIAAVIIVLVLLGVVLFGSNEPVNSPENKASVEGAMGEDKMEGKMTNKMTLDNGLVIEDVSVGEGAEAKSGDTIAVHYVGTFEDGTTFDSSRARGGAFNFTLGIGQVIPGWDQGVEGMKVGGVRKLVIPPSLAYGEAGVANAIPPNSTLFFEVELLGVQ